ncbi:subtilisin-like protein [Apiospora kogelbergensis]|uniref:subtilisin-like protein n=1 Tax=Apiospora kogelbergensis TaxID=1337665 RepID=UPI00312D2816
MSRRDEGIPHSSDDLLKFAQDAFDKTSTLAADIGVKEVSVTALRLAAELRIAKMTIETADDAHFTKLEKRSRKLVKHLERICCWPNAPAYGSQSNLCKLVRPDLMEDALGSEVGARSGITEFLRGPDWIQKDLLKRLKRFSKDSQARAATNDRNNIQASRAAPNEYPREVNATLYNVLRCHSACACGANQQPDCKQGTHATRLRLQADIVRSKEGFGFDILMHSWPKSKGHWQDIQLRVKMKSQKRARYNYDTTPVDDGQRPKLVEFGSLCNLINTRLWSRLNLQIHDSQLYHLWEGVPLQQRVRSDPSLPLRVILDTYRLSNKMKLILCYIIARSFWQYYDSPWMSTAWSNESIHFLLETSTTSQPEGLLYASKPYFAITFENSEQYFQEYCDSYSVIFRYPRILALCTLLLEIMRGQAFEPDSFDTAEARINARWDLAIRTLEDPSQWNNFEYTDFRSALGKSLMSKTFDVASARTGSGRNDLKHDLGHRRTILYDVLIEPLHNLLNFLGFEDALDCIEPMRPSERGRYYSDPPSVPGVPKPCTSVTSAESKDTRASVDWVEEIVELNTRVCNSATHTALKPHPRPVRVAVLDSGYDEDSSFFLPLVRSRRVEGWKDFAGDSACPIDENGHGTHTVALVMKMAPTAEIYVARIARDRDSMSKAPHAICQAIKWATEECKVDIISMSFGFESDINEISMAIREAELYKRGNILFFAAASNSGETGESCSQRATTLNPPVDTHGPTVFGTLGSNVSSAWLSNVDGEVAKSGSSVATAIAAGIAAMMLTCADLGFAQPEPKLPPEVERLWTRRGMLSLFLKMSEHMGNKCQFLTPSQFLGSPDGLWAGIIDACRR